MEKKFITKNRLLGPFLVLVFIIFLMVAVVAEMLIWLSAGVTIKINTLSLIISALGLVVTVVYTCLTYLIFKANEKVLKANIEVLVVNRGALKESTRINQASQRPFLVLEVKDGLLTISNNGKGTAINIIAFVKTQGGLKVSYNITPIKSGDPINPKIRLSDMKDYSNFEGLAKDKEF